MLDKQLHDMIMQLGNNSNAVRVRRENPTVTEMRDGLIVTRPISDREKEEEPVIIDLQEYARSGSKAGSSSGINKVREITEFMFSNDRIV